MTMQCKFVVGQKVVCVHGGEWWGHVAGQLAPQRANGPSRGDICKIKAIEPYGGYVWLQFAEHPSRVWYDQKCFRPLQDRPAETDISVFTKLLDSKKLEPVT